MDFIPATSEAASLKQHASPLIPVIFVLLLVALTASLVKITRFPGSFDELQHLSYAAFLQETGGWLPQFARQKTLSAVDLRVWTQAANYIGHPSPFYLFVQIFLDRGLPLQTGILAPRLASASLVWLGVALAISAGWQRFRHDAGAGLLFCCAVALCPKLLALAPQVTNDSLAFLGGALVYSGILGWSRRRAWNTLSVALGVVFALWAKPTSGLLVCVWLGLHLLITWPPRRGALVCCLAGGLVGAIPYAIMLWQYGRLVPVSLETLLPGDPAHGPYSVFAVSFLYVLGVSWRFGQMPGAVASMLFWSLMAMSGLAARAAWPARHQVSAAVAVTAPIAFLCVLPIHLWFASTVLRHSIAAASFRYYLPLWPMMAHGLAYGLMAAAKPWQRIYLLANVLTAVLLDWVLLALA